MAFSIVTNVASLLAQDNLRITGELQQRTIQRLTSGLRINSSADDAAGLAIANSFRSDIAVLQQGIRNANDGLSTLQTIDGGINNISLLLDRARTLATQSASGTFTGDRNVLNSEFQSTLDEIDRQAQAIGLDTGGIFARALSVFIGGGRGHAGDAASVGITNGTVSLDLSQSTVDASSLGLKGVQAVGGATGTTDIGSGSASTSVEDIVANATNLASLATTGYTDFYFAGPGFSDQSKVRVSVNLSGVVDTTTLATAINDAIESAGNGTTAAAQAFKNAGIKAVINTDSTGKQQLTFTSSDAAFQVEAGDRLANALLGNYTSSSDPTGKTLNITFTGAASIAAASATFDNGLDIKIRIEGGGLADAVDLSLDVSAGETVGSVLSELSAAFSASTALSDAGFSLSATAGSALVVTNDRGERFRVLVTGDEQNRLGLGTYLRGGSGGTDPLYTEITGSANGGVTFGGSVAIAIGGQGGLSPITLTVSANGSGTDTTAVQELNAQIAQSATLSAAGLEATVSGGAIKFVSRNGTLFQLSTVSDANNALGFSTYAGVTTANTLAEAAGFAEHTFNSGGADASTTGDVTSFSPIRFGSDEQTITFTANDANGAAHSLSVVLRNDATSRNGATLDEAIQAINAALQQSNDATLRRIVAVKERNDAGGAEGIRFLATLKEFRVSIGATEQGGGLNAGSATVLTSDELSGGAVTDISTKENAENAVSALSAAVSLLGTAQAAVGKGQNQLQFAIGLAATQVNNLSAAQSRIREADLAAEAANLTRASIAQQAGIAALAQANSAPQVVLALLRV
jgi:flagellin